MNISKLVKNASLVALLAGLCGPLAVGCAEPTRIERTAYDADARVSHGAQGALPRDGRMNHGRSADGRSW
jgi:hypothetical protein